MQKQKGEYTSGEREADDEMKLKAGDDYDGRRLFKAIGGGDRPSM